MLIPPAPAGNRDCKSEALKRPATDKEYSFIFLPTSADKRSGEVSGALRGGERVGGTQSLCFGAVASSLITLHLSLAAVSGALRGGQGRETGRGARALTPHSPLATAFFVSGQSRSATPPISQSSTFQNWRTLCPLRGRVGNKMAKVPVYPANLLKTN